MAECSSRKSSFNSDSIGCEEAIINHEGMSEQMSVLCIKNDPIPTDEKLSNRELKGIRRSIKVAQLERYKEIEMEIAPWMEGMNLPFAELYVELEMFITDKSGREDTGASMKIYDIFNPIKNYENPRRILIEGDAGFGKTTLLHKIVTDWTKGKQYVIGRFNQVFLFYLRNCNKGECLEDLVKEECTSLGINGEKGWKCVNEFQKATLFLLDGFDELNNESKIKFQNILQQNKFKNSTVVVTSRKGEFKIKKNVETVNPGLLWKQGKRDPSHFWDKRIVISGISKENRANFLNKYFDPTEVNVSSEKFFDLANKDLFRCPLLLILLATLKDEENVYLIDSHTTLYKFFFNVTARRNLIRIHKLEKYENVELFDFIHPNYRKEYAEQIFRFGSLAMDHLVRDQLIFTEKELHNVCGTDGIFLKLGFLNSRSSLKNRMSKVYFEPLHKSFLEFFVALKISDLVKGSDPNEDEFKERILHLMNNDILPNPSSLVYPFLAGLLTDKSYFLFKALSPCSFMCDCFSPAFLSILNEIQKREVIVEFLIPFIPKYLLIDYNFRKDHPHFQICEQLIQLFPSPLQFNPVIIAADCYHLHIPIKTKTLELNFTEDNMPNIFPPADISKIECDVLFYCFHNFNPKFWHLAVKFYSNIKTKRVHFVFKYCTYLIPLLSEEVLSGQWTEMNIVELYFFSNESFDLEIYSLLSHLNETGKIKDIVFYDSNESAEWGDSGKDFCSTILKYSKHAYLVSTSARSPSSIPFSHLCEVDKKWNFIWFTSLFNYSLPDSKMFCSVDQIKITEDMSRESFVFVMNNCFDFTTLKCFGSLLFPCYLQQNINLSTTLEKLAILLNCNLNECNFFNLLVLPHLKLLAIEFPPNHKHSLDECSKFAENLSLFVNQSNLETLDLSFFEVNEPKFLLSVLENLMNVKEIKIKNKTKLSSNKDIDFEKERETKLCALMINVRSDVISKNNQIKAVSLIKQLLRRKFVKKVILYNSLTLWKIDSSFLVSFPEDGFLISEGTDEDKALCYFNPTIDYRYFICRTLVITCNDAMSN